MAEERERWTSRTSFVMASIGAAIGLGNVWRFPYIAYTNGGGAFLVPFFVALLTAGIPLMILEYAMGRKMQAGAPTSFAKIGKNFEWIGWLALFAVMLIFAYYPVIMSWCWNYMFYSMKLGWGAEAKSFFYNNFLQLTDGPGNLGGIRWPILIGLAISWLATFLILYKGVRIVGKVVIYTVTIPWIILVIMLIRGLTLPGALEGVNYYLTPDFKALLRPGVWLAAYGQVFFSLSLGMGTLIVYSSYLSPKCDIANNAVITSLADSGTSFFAGFGVFSVVGYLAQAMNVGVPKVTTSGVGLAFITYPTAIKLLPFWAPLFGLLFFLLLLTLGIDSFFSQVEPFVAGFTDKWKFKKETVLIVVTVVGFLMGVVFTTRGGFYWLDIIDYYTCSFGLTLVAILESITIGYVYKTRRLKEYINEVSEFRIGKWCDITIMVILPLVLGVSFILELVRLIREGYGDYPSWASLLGAIVLGVLIILSFVLMRIGAREEA
jgi:NSS family neurotransmitter:Na+ symporter